MPGTNGINDAGGTNGAKGIRGTKRAFRGKMGAAEFSGIMATTPPAKPALPPAPYMSQDEESKHDAMVEAFQLQQPPPAAPVETGSDEEDRARASKAQREQSTQQQAGQAAQAEVIHEGINQKHYGAFEARMDEVYGNNRQIHEGSYRRSPTYKKGKLYEKERAEFAERVRRAEAGDRSSQAWLKKYERRASGEDVRTPGEKAQQPQAGKQPAPAAKPTPNGSAGTISAESVGVASPAPAPAQGGTPQTALAPESTGGVSEAFKTHLKNRAAEIAAAREATSPGYGVYKDTGTPGIQAAPVDPKYGGGYVFRRTDGGGSPITKETMGQIKDYGAAQAMIDAGVSKGNVTNGNQGAIPGLYASLNPELNDKGQVSAGMRPQLQQQAHALGTTEMYRQLMEGRAGPGIQPAAPATPAQTAVAAAPATPAPGPTPAATVNAPMSDAMTDRSGMYDLGGGAAPPSVVTPAAPPEADVVVKAAQKPAQAPAPVPTAVAQGLPPAPKATIVGAQAEQNAVIAGANKIADKGKGLPPMTSLPPEAKVRKAAKGVLAPQIQ